MSNYIDVKFRVDGINVMRKDSPCKVRYGVESYPNDYDGGYSVLIDVRKDDMVKVLEDNGYEVVKKEVSV